MWISNMHSIVFHSNHLSARRNRSNILTANSNQLSSIVIILRNISLILNNGMIYLNNITFTISKCALCNTSSSWIFSVVPIGLFTLYLAIILFLLFNGEVWTLRVVCAMRPLFSPTALWFQPLYLHLKPVQGAASFNNLSAFMIYVHLKKVGMGTISLIHRQWRNKRNHLKDLRQHHLHCDSCHQLLVLQINLQWNKFL